MSVDRSTLSALKLLVHNSIASLRPVLSNAANTAQWVRARMQEVSGKVDSQAHEIAALKAKVAALETQLKELQETAVRKSGA